MPGLPQKTSEEKRNIGVNDDIQTSFFVGQVSKPNSVAEENNWVVDLLFTTKNINYAQSSEALCQNLKEWLKKNGTITVNGDELLCKKAPTDGAMHILATIQY